MTDAYLDTIHRMEPGITRVDAGAAAASISISLRRIADLLEAPDIDTGEVITLPQVLLRGAKALERIAANLDLVTDHNSFPTSSIATSSSSTRG